MEVAVIWHLRPVLREGLAAGLSRHPRVLRTRVATAALDLVALCREVQATTVIVDLDDDSPELWAALRDLGGPGGPRLLALHSRAQAEVAVQAFSAGVRLLLPLHDGMAHVHRALDRPRVTTSAFGEPTPAAPLGEIELAIVRLLSLGRTPRAVATRLGVTLGQVEAARRRARRTPTSDERATGASPRP